MTYQAPAFWAKYRGRADPAVPLTTPYTYNSWFYLGAPYPTGVEIVGPAFTVMGPPQLTKENYIEIRWAVIPALIMVRITLNDPGTLFWDSNGAEGGFRDEGRFHSMIGGVPLQ